MISLRSMAKQRSDTHGGHGGECRGQSLVEMAITLPLMLLLVMGVVDFGVVLYAHVQVAAASGQGARAGSLYAGDLLQSRDANTATRENIVKQAVLASMGRLDTSSPFFDLDSDVSVTYPNADPTNVTASGEVMVVTVSYRQPLWFDILPSWITGLSGGSFPVTSRTAMRVQ